MITKAGQKDIGAVGCLLLYEDRDTIQHAGVYLVSGGYADHLHMNEKYSSSLNEHAKNELDYLKDKEVIAVTAAALLVEKKKFEETGGFNEKFVVCGGDVDLCLRLGEKGYKSFYIGSKGFIIHKESQSRQGNEIPYIDFIESFKSYRKYFDKKNND
jgi:GT2 family glycosyltransferase